MPSKPLSRVNGAALMLPKKFAMCRVYRHPWEQYDAERVGRFYHDIVHCPRCDMYRTTRINNRGYAVSRWYKVPDGYYVEGGVNSNTLAAMRLQLVTNFIELKEAA